MATAPKTVGQEQREQARRLRANSTRSRKIEYDWRWRKFRHAYLMELFSEGHVHCELCGQMVQTTNHLAQNAAELDHRVPPYRFGEPGTAEYDEAMYSPGNLQLSCKSCNSRKQDK